MMKKLILFISFLSVQFCSFSQYELICIDHIGPSYYTIIPVYIVKGVSNYEPIITERADSSLFFQPLDSLTYDKTDSLLISSKFKTKLKPKKIMWGSFKITSFDSNNKLRYVYYIPCSKEALSTFRYYLKVCKSFPEPELLIRKMTYYIELLEMGDEKIKNKENKE